VNEFVNSAKKTSQIYMRLHLHHSICHAGLPTLSCCC